MYLVIIRLLYSLCCIVIADRRGVRAQGSKGSKIYILCGEVARAGGGRASRGQMIAIDFSLFSGILSAVKRAKL